MTDDFRRSNEPVDRFGRIADRLFDHLRDDDEHHPDDRLIVLLTNGTTSEGMTGHTGYDEQSSDDDVGPVLDLFVHLRAIFRANGKAFAVAIEGPDGVEVWPPDVEDLRNLSSES